MNVGGGYYFIKLPYDKNEGHFPNLHEVIENEHFDALLYTKIYNEYFFKLYK